MQRVAKATLLSLAAKGAAASDAFTVLSGARPETGKALRASYEQHAEAPVSAPRGSVSGSAGLVVAVAGAAAALASGRRFARVAAPAATRKPTTLKAGPKVLEGTGGPAPNDFWDPAGLANGKSDEQLIHWRNVELKHGRVAMLACLGWFHVAAGWHPVGDYAVGVRLSNDPLVNVTQLPMGGAWQVVFTIMCVEWMFSYVTPAPKDEPWDLFGFHAILADADGSEVPPEVPWREDWANIKLQELNNGRLAMFGILGLIAQDLAGGGYFQGIGEICFGAKICENWEEWDPFFPFPRAPYNPPALYPGGKPPLDGLGSGTFLP